jgi:hypothetical protein
MRSKHIMKGNVPVPPNTSLTSTAWIAADSYRNIIVPWTLHGYRNFSRNVLLLDINEHASATGRFGREYVQKQGLNEILSL